VVPVDTPVKAAQFLASDSPCDGIGEIVDLLVCSEADLWMGFQLGRKPGSPALGRADADKVNLRHIGHYWRGSSRSKFQVICRVQCTQTISEENTNAGNTFQ